MQPSEVKPPFDRLLATAEDVVRARPEVDPEMAREVFLEAATLLYNGLAVEGLDEHDADAVVAGLCRDLCAPDPGAAVRAHVEEALAAAAAAGHPGAPEAPLAPEAPDAPDAPAAPGSLHDPRGVAAAYEISLRILQL